jgi:hypothetical protein
MESLTPPTDSLYKFIAISGVAIVLVSFYTLTSAPREFQQRGRDVALKEAQVRAELENMSNRVVRFEQRLDNALADTNAMPAEAKQAWREGLESLITDAYSLNQQVYAISVQLDFRDKDEAIVKESVRRSYYGAAVGLVIGIIGFALWYRRIQRYQDAALRKAHQREASS